MKGLIFIANMLVFTGFSQNGSISGIIKTEDSISVVAYTKVFLKDTKYYSLSNGNGVFYFENVPQGNYELVINPINYISKKITLQVSANKNTYIEVFLAEKISVLPEVVVGTSGQSDLLNVSGSVSLIGQKEMETFGYSDINKTLKLVPGVNLQEEDGFGLRPNIGLRGTGVERSSKITIMEDGILMAPAPYIAPSAYYFPTIGRMQGVEVIKGSSQIKYGPYTTGGAINLISTQIPQSFAGKIDLIAGSFGSKTVHTYVGNSYKQIGFLVETYQFGADGFKTIPNHEFTGFKKEDYLAKLRLNSKKTKHLYQQLDLKVGQASEHSNETYLGLTEQDFLTNPYQRYLGSQMDNMTTLQHQFSTTYLVKFSKKWSVITSAYYSDFKRNWYKLDKVADSSGTKQKIGQILSDESTLQSYYNILKGNPNQINNTLFVKANNRSYYAKGIQSVLTYKTSYKKTFHKIDIGIRVHQDQIDRFQWVDDYVMDNGTMKLINKGVAGTESNRIETANALASYIQYKFSYKKLILTPGLRYENIQMQRLDYGKNDVERTGKNLNKRSNYVDLFIPGIGLNYKLTKQWVGFMGIHKGFAPPGTKPGTKPEESINYEVGTRYVKQSLLVDAVIFYNDYSNLLGVDLQASGGNGTNDLFNGGRVKTYGLEFKLSYDLLSFYKKIKINLPTTVVYTYTDATFLTDFDSEFEGWGNVKKGDKYPYLSKHQTTFIIGIEHQKFNVYSNFNYKSKMFTQPTSDINNLKYQIPAYYTVDISATYYLHTQINLFASVNNITNAIYTVAKRPAGLRPGMPRAFNIGVKVKI